MSADGGAIASDAINSFGSAPSSTPGSPKNRFKFLCSHGGKILPRPADGQLKYVGGETRVISVARDISFQELMKKLTYLIDGEMILKYQVESEDLDALVSVKSDEDVAYMCDEIDRHQNATRSRLRAFLFPANPLVMEKQIASSVDLHALEQRYIDSINGIIRTAPNSVKQHPTIVNTVQQHGSLVSSGCSSPRSPDSCAVEAFNNSENLIPQSNYHNSRMISVHRVQSSPNISSMNVNVNVPQQSNHFIHQLSSPQPQQYVHHYPPSPGYQAPKPPIDLQRSERRLISVRSVGRAEGVRYQLDPTALLPPHYYTSKQNRGNGCCVKSMHYDDSTHYPDRRTGSRAMSPVPSTTRLGHADL